MLNSIRNRGCLLIELAIVSFFLSGCGKFLYTVEAVNAGDYGVIIEKITNQSISEERLVVVYPGREQPVHLQAFKEPGGKLPDTVTVQWKLAKLEDCGYEDEYGNRSKCRFNPINNELLVKRFDMEGIRQTEAYKRTGKSYDGIGGSRYVLRLRFEFHDEDLKLIAYNDVTNPWK